MATEASVLSLLLERGDEGALLAVLTSLASLDPACLVAAACTCRHLRTLLDSSHSPWAAAVEADWRGKLYVSAEARQLLADGEPRRALACARLDARRNVLREDELISLPWRFRFKATAGADWTQLDRWWRGKQASRVLFSADGRVQRVDADENDFLADVDIRWCWARIGASFTPDAEAERGQLLRLRVDGRAVPSYEVSRTRNWGWVMESVWGMYCSFEPPARAEESQDPQTRVDVDGRWPALQAMEAAMFNAGLDPLGADYEAEGDEEAVADE